MTMLAVLVVLVSLLSQGALTADIAGGTPNPTPTPFLPPTPPTYKALDAASNAAADWDPDGDPRTVEMRHSL